LGIGVVFFTFSLMRFRKSIASMGS